MSANCRLLLDVEVESGVLKSTVVVYYLVNDEKLNEVFVEPELSICSIFGK